MSAMMYDLNNRCTARLGRRDADRKPAAPPAATWICCRPCLPPLPYTPLRSPRKRARFRLHAVRHWGGLEESRPFEVEGRDARVTVSIDGDVYSGQSVDGLMRSGDGAF
jgi:hypothetical protein